MKPVVKYALWAVILGSLTFAGIKLYKNYKAKQAAQA